MEICVSKSIGLACSGKEIYHFCFVLLQVQAPRGGLYSKGQFNGGFFALRFWGAYIWRGLYSEFYGMRTRLFTSIVANRQFHIKP